MCYFFALADLSSFYVVALIAALIACGAFRAHKQIMERVTKGLFCDLPSATLLQLDAAGAHYGI